jgi:hypothetical protein
LGDCSTSYITLPVLRALPCPMLLDGDWFARQPHENMSSMSSFQEIGSL